MTICASHIERLIVYKHFGGSWRGRSIYCWLQLQITLIVIRLLQRTVKPGSTPLSNVKNQGRAIDNFRCAFLIYGLVHCPYLGISNTAESCLANMPLANSTGPNEMLPMSLYVNWNKHPVPIPPSSRLIHYELQHSYVTSCRKSWCESCWYSCNCEGPPIKIHFSIDLSNCYSYNHVIMYTCDCQFH